jgi:hypothetical protein
MYDQHVIKKTRQRRYGGRRKPSLASMKDKLVFILFYFKVYPLQEIMAFLFENRGLTPFLFSCFLPERRPQVKPSAVGEKPNKEFHISILLS